MPPPFLQLATLNVVRLIQLWRRNLWRPHPFVYQKDGSVDCNYMLKMGSDLGVLRMEVYMDVLRGVPLQEKDLVCVLFPDPKHTTRRPDTGAVARAAAAAASSSSSAAAAARHPRHVPTAGGGGGGGTASRGAKTLSDRMTRMAFDHLLATHARGAGGATVGLAALQSMDLVRELMDGGRLPQRVFLDIYREAAAASGSGGDVHGEGDGGLTFAGFERFLDLITPLADADVEPSYTLSADTPPDGRPPNGGSGGGSAGHGAGDDDGHEPDVEYADGFDGDNPLREAFFLDRDLEELKTAAKVVAEEAKLQQALRTEQRALMEKKVFIPLLRTTKKKAK
jgi:hypothetical protein